MNRPFSVGIRMAALQEKNDVKIFILYILRNVGYALDYATIIDLVLGDGAVRYIDFAECFAELVDTGNVERLSGSKEVDIKTDEEFIITEQGVRVSDALSSDLSTYIRDTSLHRAIRYLSFKKDGTNVKCNVSPLYDGRSRVRFSFEKKEEVLLSVDMLSDNEKQTEMVRRALDRDPEKVYRGIIAMMSGDADFLF